MHHLALAKFLKRFSYLCVDLNIFARIFLAGLTSFLTVDLLFKVTTVLVLQFREI